MKFPALVISCLLSSALPVAAQPYIWGTVDPFTFPTLAIASVSGGGGGGGTIVGPYESMAISSDRRTVYVSKTSGLMRFDAVTLSFVDTLSDVPAYGGKLTVSPSGRWWHYTGRFPGKTATYTIVDALSHQVVHEEVTGVVELAFSPDAMRRYELRRPDEESADYTLHAVSDEAAPTTAWAVALGAGINSVTAMQADAEYVFLVISLATPSGAPRQTEVRRYSAVTGVEQARASVNNIFGDLPRIGLGGIALAQGKVLMWRGGVIALLDRLTLERLRIASAPAEATTRYLNIFLTSDGSIGYWQSVRGVYYPKIYDTLVTSVDTETLEFSSPRLLPRFFPGTFWASRLRLRHQTWCRRQRSDSGSASRGSQAQGRPPRHFSYAVRVVATFRRRLPRSRTTRGAGSRPTCPQGRTASKSRRATCLAPALPRAPSSSASMISLHPMRPLSWWTKWPMTSSD